MNHDHQQMQHDEHGAHDKHAGHSVAMFRDKFWWSVALTVPTIIWSPMVQQWLGYHAPAFPGSTYIPALFGAILFFYGGVVFLRGGAPEVQEPVARIINPLSLS